MLWDGRFNDYSYAQYVALFCDGLPFNVSILVLPSASTNGVGALKSGPTRHIFMYGFLLLQTSPVLRFSLSPTQGNIHVGDSAHAKTI